MKKDKTSDTVPINPIVDKYHIIKKLQALAEESKDIAEYIDGSISYGRALGYAQGKYSAYLEIAEHILKGEFDAALDGNGEIYGYND